jgi:hypothetical protein
MDDVAVGLYDMERRVAVDAVNRREIGEVTALKMFCLWRVWRREIVESVADIYVAMGYEI